MEPGEVVLVLGGARSGKSSFAQNLACTSGLEVVYIATAQVTDPEMAARIQHHRDQRPASWRTVEAPLELVPAVQAEAGRRQVILLDCLSVWVANRLLRGIFPDAGQKELNLPAGRQEEVLTQVERLTAVGLGAQASLVVVTNEVGMALVPEYQAGRIYRDVLGLANQIVARAAARVYLVVAGIPVLIKGRPEGDVGSGKCE
ncbi:MAG: bifunctional adenosylcobinamide kinase/adenosylcobinamide-phosphate guanylyltransferase [Clostridia bacterium]|nr:MAG: bifunctional adenosylcobinamide kinase/adenosylcobinamide-phosphate guanylyltransferase [Clostridia bacterium]